MLDFVRVACAVPDVRVGDPLQNARRHCAILEKADAQKVDVLVFPELSLTGYTCQDLFFQDSLNDAALAGLGEILNCSRLHPDVVAVVGLPVRLGCRMFNCAAVLSGGMVHGLVPKTYIPNYHEFYEKRWFSSGEDLHENQALLQIPGMPAQTVPVLPKALLALADGTVFGVEICEDLWTPIPPSSILALSGAEVIVNLSASNETIGKGAYRRELVTHQSAAAACVYAYASAGAGRAPRI